MEGTRPAGIGSGGSRRLIRLTGRRVALRLLSVPGILAAVLGMQVVPGASARASEGAPPAEQFRCDTPTGVWQKLTGGNHDNLRQQPRTLVAVPGQRMPLTLTWEWRDWRPGALLTVRLCIDVDGSVDGTPSAPFEDLGANPPDAVVVHPTTEPEARVDADVDGHTELRPAVEVPVSFVVPASVPAGGELCVRSAVFGDPSDHRHSPPVFDVSATTCLIVLAPQVTPAPSPPVPSPSPEVAVEILPAPEVSPVVTPSAEVLAQRQLPYTGSSMGWLVAGGLAFLVLGSVACGIGRRTTRDRTST